MASVYLQSAALPYRANKKGQVEILLVSTSRRQRWSLPKGAAEPHLSLSQNAAKEAYEEAGVKGEPQEPAAGSYRTLKRLPDGREVVIEVWVYRLFVTKTLKDWPERHRRQVQWVSAAKAASLLREPTLKELCLSLAKELQPASQAV